ncbi:MAG: hypothetical protein Q4B90_05375 [Eubacteriales bacterium]|nr:hypothetical protein [Eubacteriales bacterium]
MKNMKKKILSLNLSVTLHHTVSGAVWFLYGILSSFQGLSAKILSAIIIVAGILCTLITFFRKTEPEDEMAKYNLAKAHRFALSNLLLIMIVIEIVQLFSNQKVELSYERTFPFLFGIGQLFIGAGFAFYEKAGSE